MARLVLELTNRCNLSCHHCFSGRHGGKDELPLDLLAGVLSEARASGFDYVAFTGGEPTAHHAFAEVLRLTYEADYQFGFVTNGWNFCKSYSLLLPYLDQLGTVTFSMDGATEGTHDQLRGQGSYRRVLQAMSICVIKQIPFSINMVITSHNRHELRRMAELGCQLGSRGVRFCHLMHSPLTTQKGYDLSPQERKDVELVIRDLQQLSSFPIAMAPGYHTRELFPCAPLQMTEVNVDCYGNLTKCCHLSGHGDGAATEDVICNLSEISFTEGYQQLVKENEAFRQTKARRLAAGLLKDTDSFPCWYCSLRYGKVNWLREHNEHQWAAALSAWVD